MGKNHRQPPEIEDAMRKLQAEAALFGVSAEVMMLARLNAHYQMKAQRRSDDRAGACSPRAP